MLTPDFYCRWVAGPRKTLGVPLGVCKGNRMVVIASTNDPVRLTFLVSLLRDGGFQPMLYDENMAAVEGSIGAVMRRIAVPDEADSALQYLRAAGEL
jgi:hypothetical protein